MKDLLELQEEVAKDVLKELKEIEISILSKINTLGENDLSHPDMKAVDWVHDACHTRMLKRGPIDSMSVKRSKQSEEKGE